MFVVLVGVLLLLENVNGHGCALCGGTCAEDTLAALPCAEGSMVRPKTLVRPSYTVPLVGDGLRGPCFRHHAIVKPATLPKPLYLQADTSAVQNSENAGLKATGPQVFPQSSTNSADHIVNQGVPLPTLPSLPPGYQPIDLSRAYAEACNGYRPPGVPADAVSLALAYKQHAMNVYGKKIAEDRLSYGFRKLPIELPVPSYDNVGTQINPEVHLYALNGQIVELKPVAEPVQSTHDKLAEEALEELLDLGLGEEANDIPVAKMPNLDELGYGPAKVSPVTFVEIPPIPMPAPPPPPTPMPSPPPIVAACNESETAPAPISEATKPETIVYNDIAKVEPTVKVEGSHDNHVEAMKHTYDGFKYTDSSSGSCRKKKVGVHKLCSS